jgi:endonuclease/exonuclease/phosphatase family metal-dependent hydrolase
MVAPMLWKPARALALSISLVTAALAAAPTLSSTAATGTDPSELPATSRVASFNVLGDSHTRTGRKASMGSGVERMRRTVKILDKRELDLVGFQEMQRVQVQEFLRLRTTEWGIYPGLVLTPRDGENTIAWRRSVWTLVEVDTQTIPYFNGRTREMPILLLQHNATGEQVYVMNVHNPATNRRVGNQDYWRDQAMAIEAAKVNEMKAASQIPILVLGDMNEREDVFCYFGQQARLRAANGAGYKANAKGCLPPPRPMSVDWIFGTKDVAFSDYAALRTTRIERTTDHPVVVATATLPVPVSGKR